MVMECIEAIKDFLKGAKKIVSSSRWGWKEWGGEQNRRNDGCKWN